MWHLAEARSLPGYEKFTRDYWGSTNPPLPVHERVELLWRLEILQHVPTDDAAWKALAAEGERLLEHADALTLWMHHWIGLAFARAGDMAKAERQVRYLRQLPAGRPSGHWSTLGADLLEGELAIVRGDDAEGVRRMATAIRDIHSMGGAAQAEGHSRTFELSGTGASATCGRSSRWRRRDLLQNPNHVQSLAALAWAYGRTGASALERDARAQLVRKAEAIGVHPDLPAVVRARHALRAA